MVPKVKKPYYLGDHLNFILSFTKPINRMQNTGNLRERAEDADIEHDVVSFVELNQNLSMESEGHTEGEQLPESSMSMRNAPAFELSECSYAFIWIIRAQYKIQEERL